MFVQTDAVEADLFHELKLFHVVLVGFRRAFGLIVFSADRILEPPGQILAVGNKIESENLHAATSSDDFPMVNVAVLVPRPESIATDAGGWRESSCTARRAATMRH